MLRKVQLSPVAETLLGDVMDSVFPYLKASNSTVQQLTRRKNGQSRSGTWETGGLVQIYCCEFIQASSPLDFISP